jgi:hypothetical protein
VRRVFKVMGMVHLCESSPHRKELPCTRSSSK